MEHYLNIDDLKRIENELLIVMDSYCREHNLRYYLTYGTLIGAVRHQGFIPWDDDIDVIMPRADYNNLIKNFNKECQQSDVSLLSHTIDPKYYLPIAKLVNTKTVLKENVDADYEMGVYLDIFPLENLPDDLTKARQILKTAFRYDQMLTLKTLKWRKGRSFLKNIELVISKALLSRKRIGDLLDKLDEFCCRTSESSPTEYVGVLAGISKGDDSRIFKREWFEETVPVQFEGNTYPAPIGYDPLLRQLYGDYMCLPPAEERVTHHVFTAWEKPNN